jgi:ubiquitin C-terminal hydrolase
MASSNYHLPTIAAVAGFALAASSYVLSNNSFESKKRRRRIKNKIQRERDGKYIYGLTNTGNFCFVNSVLQVES